MLFTTLMNSAGSEGLFPAPQAPYDGWSVKSMAAKIENLKVVSLCDTLITGGNNSCQRVDAAHYQLSYAKYHLACVQTSVKGLEVAICFNCNETSSHVQFMRNYWHEFIKEMIPTFMSSQGLFFRS